MILTVFTYPHGMVATLKESQGINIITKLWLELGFVNTNRSSSSLNRKKSLVESVFLSVLVYGDIIRRWAAASTLTPLDHRTLLDSLY